MPACAAESCDLPSTKRGRHRRDAFDGKVVWITGASQGLGAVLAHYFSSQGARLILSSRSSEKLEVRGGGGCLVGGGGAHVLRGLLLWWWWRCRAMWASIAMQRPRSNPCCPQPLLPPTAPQPLPPTTPPPLNPPTAPQPLPPQRVKESCTGRYASDALVLPFDLSAPAAELEAVARGADAAFGGAGVDYLIHNAGASRSHGCMDGTHCMAAHTACVAGVRLSGRAFTGRAVPPSTLNNTHSDHPQPDRCRRQPARSGGGDVRGCESAADGPQHHRPHRAHQGDAASHAGATKVSAV